jgi:hypothetical protein
MNPHLAAYGKYVVAAIISFAGRTADPRCLRWLSPSLVRSVPVPATASHVESVRLGGRPSTPDRLKPRARQLDTSISRSGRQSFLLQVQEGVR